jgi:hypothetical protein
MRVIEIRPARIQARYIEIGDMLVSSPIGTDGAKTSRWIGRVTEQVDTPNHEGDWRQWRIELVSGQFTESAAVPADGFVWVHLPSAGEVTV